MSITELRQRIDSQQRRRPWLAFPVAVLRKYVDDQGGQLAALISYWGFFSLFPLLLVFVTILGIVLHGDPAARKAVEHSTLSQYPIIGEQLEHNVRSLTGSPLVLLAGLLGTLFAGLGVTGAVQNAFNEVWQVQRHARAGFLSWRLRGIGQLALLGVLAIFSTLAAGFVTAQAPPGLLTAVAAALVAFAANIVLFYISFRLYSPRRKRQRSIWRGVLSAAVGWQLMQHLGGFYVAHAIRHASATSGLFALVLGLLIWLYLGARLLVIAIEIDVVAELGLWPRSLDPAQPLPADHKALAGRGRIEALIAGERIDVGFDEPPTVPPRD